MGERKDLYRMIGLSGIGLLLGGVGIALANEDVRRRVRAWLEWIEHHLHESPRRLGEWNEAAQLELLRIEEKIRAVRKTIEAV